jgi:hypothetical protein
MQALLACCLAALYVQGVNCLTNAWEASYRNSKQSYPHPHHHHLTTHALAHMPHKRISDQLRKMQNVQSDSLRWQGPRDGLKELGLALDPAISKPLRGLKRNSTAMLPEDAEQRMSHHHTNHTNNTNTPYVCVSARPSHVRLS